MIEFQLKTESIALHQALKAAGLCASGAEAKHAVAEGLVKVDSALERRKSRQLRAGQIIEFAGEKILLLSASN